MAENDRKCPCKRLFTFKGRRYRLLEIKAQNPISVQKFNNENKFNVIKFTLNFYIYCNFTLKTYYWLGAQLNDVVG